MERLLTLAVEWATEPGPVRRADLRLPGRLVPARRLGRGRVRGAAAHPRGRLRSPTPAPIPRSSTPRRRSPSCSRREAAFRCADRVVQVFGGRGYMREYPAERFFRELRVDRIWEGTSEIQRLIVARALEKRGVDEGRRVSVERRRRRGGRRSRRRADRRRRRRSTSGRSSPRARSRSSARRPRAASPRRSATTCRVMESATRCHFVNPRYDELYGQPCYPSLDALPERPGHRPRRASTRSGPRPSSEDAAQAGVPSVIIPGGGVVEGGEAAAQMQREVRGDRDPPRDRPPRPELHGHGRPDDERGDLHRRHQPVAAARRRRRHRPVGLGDRRVHPLRATGSASRGSSAAAARSSSTRATSSPTASTTPRRTRSSCSSRASSGRSGSSPSPIARSRSASRSWSSRSAAARQAQAAAIAHSGLARRRGSGDRRRTPRGRRDPLRRPRRAARDGRARRRLPAARAGASGVGGPASSRSRPARRRSSPTSRRGPGSTCRRSRRRPAQRCSSDLPTLGYIGNPLDPWGATDPTDGVRRGVRRVRRVGRLRRPRARPRLPVPIAAVGGRDGPRGDRRAAPGDGRPAGPAAGLRLADLGRADARDEAPARRRGRRADAPRGGRGVHARSRRVGRVGAAARAATRRARTDPRRAGRRLRPIGRRGATTPAASGRGTADRGPSALPERESLAAPRRRRHPGHGGPCRRRCRRRRRGRRRARRPGRAEARRGGPRPQVATSAAVRLDLARRATRSARRGGAARARRAPGARRRRDDPRPPRRADGRARPRADRRHRPATRSSARSSSSGSAGSSPRCSTTSSLAPRPVSSRRGAGDARPSCAARGCSTASGGRPAIDRDAVAAIVVALGRARRSTAPTSARSTSTRSIAGRDGAVAVDALVVLEPG